MNHLKQISLLPQGRDFYPRAAVLASKAGEKEVERAAERAQTIFSKLEPGYWEGKNCKTYYHWQTYPYHGTLAENSVNSDEIVALARDAEKLTVYIHVPWCTGK